jgi:hypothetical protein
VKISIDAGGRSVEIECSDANVTVDSIGEKALQLWQATNGAQASEGPAYGFTAQTQLHTNRSTYGPASFRHDDRTTEYIAEMHEFTDRAYADRPGPREQAYRAVWHRLWDGLADPSVWRTVEAALDAYEAAAGKPTASPRWTPQAEEILGKARKDHEVTYRQRKDNTGYIWQCPCGEGRDETTDWDTMRDEAITHERRAILGALADAGLLVTP